MYGTENVEQIDPHAGGYTNTVDSWTDIQTAVVNNLMFTHTGALAILASAAGRHATVGTPTALHNARYKQNVSTSGKRVKNTKTKL